MPSSVLAASNVIPVTNILSTSVAASANTLKPSDCSSITLSNLIVGSGTITGTNGNDLILGSSGADTINGKGGSDCILGGDGNDTINGGGGGDICIGGPGTDSFSHCTVTTQ